MLGSNMDKIEEKSQSYYEQTTTSAIHPTSASCSSSIQNSMKRTRYTRKIFSQNSNSALQNKVETMKKQFAAKKIQREYRSYISK